MKRQIQVEFLSPDKDLVTLMQWADRRGAVIVRCDDEPAYLMMTAEIAIKLLSLAIQDSSLPLDEALRAYDKILAGPPRRAYHRLPRLGSAGEPRRPLPTFGDVTAADQIVVSESPPDDKRRRLTEKVRSWPAFVADELMRRFDAYLDSPSQKTWNEYVAYINFLLEHAMLIRDMPRTDVPIVYCYGALPSDNDAGDDD
jgi:hypothetical protein